MSPRILMGAVAGAAALTLAACMGDRTQTPPFYQDMARVDGQVDAATAAQMISQYRINNGLLPVKPDPRLTTIAKSQADAMAAAGTVKASLAPSQQLAARMASIGEPKTEAAENVSAGYRTFAEAFSGWRESPKHNQVLLTGDATRLGIATTYASNAKHKVFWSLVMAGPAPTAASAQALTPAR
ncbi:CAP domain-containing protein [Roseibium sp. AS2]|uniref:CAP domain-containing protein n=1 Tax=Roseibium sp. AS2 TaxID=3135781 RepID=UPI0031706EC7